MPGLHKGLQMDYRPTIQGAAGSAPTETRPHRLSGKNRRSSGRCKSAALLQMDVEELDISGTQAGDVRRLPERAGPERLQFFPPFVGDRYQYAVVRIDRYLNRLLARGLLYLHTLPRYVTLIFDLDLQLLGHGTGNKRRIRLLSSSIASWVGF